VNHNKKTVPMIAGRKNSLKKIVALTAFDYSFSRLIDTTDIDIILVGDSLAMVALGHSTTLPVTIEEMIILESKDVISICSTGLSRKFFYYDQSSILN